MLNSLALALVLASPAQLVGVWVAEKNYTPSLPKSITITWHTGWKSHQFTYPDRSALRVRVHVGSLVGQFVQPPNAENPYRIATPVTFERVDSIHWIGSIHPIPDLQHLVLYVSEQRDGTTRAFLRNPERNAGVAIGTRTVEISDNAVRLRRQSSSDIVGEWSPMQRTLTLHDPGLPGAFTFMKAGAGATEDYAYQIPAQDGDGWETASLASQDIDQAKIIALVEKIRSTQPALGAAYIQSLLIARHGKLVLDTYFNGYDVSRPHDMRSAGKSVTTLLFGKALETTPLLTPSSTVASILTQYAPFKNDDGRKARITLGDLMSMSAGFACDDNDDASPGNEDSMQSQTVQPDWYRFTLDLPMIFDPGTDARYCSADINLLGAVISKAAGAWLPDYFYDSFAAPMNFGPYGMWITPPPVNDAYMAGGDQFRPRDFLKFGQLFLSGGRWKGRHIVSAAWLSQCAAKHSYIKDGGGDYGYGWHLETFRLNGQPIRAISAGGNGGQLLYAFPQLDAVAMITAANYGQYPVWSKFGTEIVADGILPAMENEK